MPIQLASVFLLICYKQVCLLFSAYIYPPFSLSLSRARARGTYLSRILLHDFCEFRSCETMKKLELLYGVIFIRNRFE